MGTALASTTAGERTWSIYRLVASTGAGHPRVRAYAGTHFIVQGHGADVEAAFAATERQLRRRQEGFQRRRVAGIPQADEFRDLIEVLPRASRTRILHLFHCHLGLGAATASAVGRAAAKDVTHVWWAYERFGRKVASALSGAIPEQVPPELYEGRAVLTFAELSRASVLDDWRITLRPELLEALADLGLDSAQVAA